jgi:hypothetical protein
MISPLTWAGEITDHRKGYHPIFYGLRSVRDLRLVVVSGSNFYDGVADEQKATKPHDEKRTVTISVPS